MTSSSLGTLTVTVLLLALIGGKCAAQEEISRASESGPSMLSYRAFIPPNDFTFTSRAQSDLADPVAAMQEAAEFFGTDPSDEFLRPLIPSYQVFPPLQSHDGPWERRIWIKRYTDPLSMMIRVVQADEGRYEFYLWTDWAKDESRSIDKCSCGLMAKRGDLIMCRVDLDKVSPSLIPEAKSSRLDGFRGDIYRGPEHLPDLLTVETATSSKMYVTRFDAWRRTDREAQSFKKIREFLRGLTETACRE